MEKVYRDYAMVMLEIKDLEKKGEELKAVLVEKLKDEEGGKKETPLGKFTLSQRLSWVYSEKVKAMEDKIKIAKDKEQKKGIAKSTATEYVLFTTPKE